MWIFLNDAFLSMVAHRTKPGVLMVRARVRGDIERVFSGAKVSRTPDADYLYRAEIPVRDAAEAIERAVCRITYPNFKNSVRDTARHCAYGEVWGVMYTYQRREAAAEPPNLLAPGELPLEPGSRFWLRSGLEVEVEQLGPRTDFRGTPFVRLRYVSSGRRYVLTWRQAKSRLRDAVFLGPRALADEPA